jgi:hypothetical protein
VSNDSTDTVADDDEDDIAEDIASAVDMDCATPMPGVFSVSDAIVEAWKRMTSASAAKYASRHETRDNPKDIIGSDKLPLHLWPTTASAMGCIALLNGALKYGRSNWRHTGVRSSVYVDACQRHLAAWFEGENEDEEGVPHLSAALACLAIIVDCQAAGKLKDDRQFPGGHRKLIDSLTPHVRRLKELHADKSPTHYDART